MPKFHVNNITGQVNICSAKTMETCKYYKEQGISAPHFDNEKSARIYAERMLSNKFKYTKPIISNNSKDNNKGIKIHSFKNANNELNELISKSRGGKINEFNKNGLRFTQYKKIDEYSYASLTDVAGIVKPELLDENSYKDFGFNINIFNEPYLQDVYHYDISDLEMDLHSSDDQLSIYDFTEYGFNDFNDLLFRRKGFTTDSEKYKKDYDKYKLDIESIDRILDNSPKVNKIVYRGLRANSSVLLNVPGRNKNEKIANYANNVHKIGNVIEYAGYQSTSTDATMAKNFASSGILFQIMTPEGANIKCISKYSAESEVLTPRNSRYVIVGNQEFVQHGKNFFIVQMVAVNKNNEILNSYNGDIKPSFNEVMKKPVNYGLPWS